MLQYGPVSGYIVSSAHCNFIVNTRCPAIISPHFFENRRGVAQTVNSDRYCAMPREFLVPQLQEFDGFNQDTWFEQDGATAHTARASMEVVRELFPEKVIFRFGDLHWPARYPDLTPLDFFFVEISQK